MKRYHGVSPLEQKRSMPAWLAKPSFVIGLLIVLVVILMALFPQFIAPYDPIATDVTVSNQAPSAAHWFGTDFYGRDIFSRVIWGTRIDLLIGVLGVVIPFLVGGMIGLLAGYYGGFLDSLLMRITDIMMAFPFTILVITIMAILGQGLINLFIALWLVGWMSYAKLVRSECWCSRTLSSSRPRGWPASPTPGFCSATCCPTSSARRWSSPPPTWSCACSRARP